MAWLTVPTRGLGRGLGDDDPCAALKARVATLSAAMAAGNPGAGTVSAYNTAVSDLSRCVPPEVRNQSFCSNAFTAAQRAAQPDQYAICVQTRRTPWPVDSVGRPIATAGRATVPSSSIRGQPKISEITPQDVVAMQTQDVLARTQGATAGGYKRLDLQQLGPGPTTASLPGQSWGDQTIYFPGIGQVRKQTLAVVGGVGAVGWLGLMALWGMTR